MINFEEAKNKSLTVRWKIGTCFSGEKCWCRTILLEEPIFYSHRDIEEEFIVVGDAAIDKETAEYLVDLHNNSLSNG